MAKIEMPRLVREMVKFGMVGGISLALDTTLMNVSHHFMHNAAGLLPVAVAIGYACGTVNGYFMNSRWTFRYQTKGQETKKLLQFATVSGVGFLLTELIVVSLFYKFGLNKNIGKLAFATPVVFFWNFSANKLWTFRRHPSPE